jgi:hypothetical protein
MELVSGELRHPASREFIAARFSKPEQSGLRSGVRESAAIVFRSITGGLPTAATKPIYAIDITR